MNMQINPEQMFINTFQHAKPGVIAKLGKRKDIKLKNRENTMSRRCL